MSLLFGILSRLALFLILAGLAVWIGFWPVALVFAGIWLFALTGSLCAWHEGY